MVIKIASIPIIGEDEGNARTDWLQEFERPSNGQLSYSNITDKDSDHLKDYNANDIILAVEQPDGGKYAIARLLKEVKFIPKEELDEGPSQSLVNNRDSNVSEVVSCKSGEQNSNERGYASSLAKTSESVEKLPHKDLVSIENAFDQVHTPCTPPHRSLTPTMDEEDVMERSFLTNLTSEIVALVQTSPKEVRVER